MSVLLLVRHGQACFGSADYDRLSDLGERQSHLLGASLAARGVRPDVLLRGSMTRHRQTAVAAVAGAGWAADVVEDPGWDEFDHLSTLDGRVLFEEVEDEAHDDRAARFDAAIERWSSGHHDDDYRETFPTFRTRVAEALTRAVAALDPGQTAVVFTSGGPVSWVAATLADGGVPAWARLSKVVVNSSVTKVLSGRRGTNLIAFNDHSHLETGTGLITYR
jgi:broad specificity phosphatase PhoE